MKTLRFKPGDTAIVRGDSPIADDCRRYIGTVVWVEEYGDGIVNLGGYSSDYHIVACDGRKCFAADEALDPLADPDKYDYTITAEDVEHERVDS